MSTASGRWLLPASVVLTAVMLHGWLFPVQGLPSSRGDSGQMAWNLWHATEAIWRGETPYQTSLVYYPVGANLATHTLGAGFLPVAALVKLASGGDPLYPFYAYKLAVYLCFLLLLVFSYLFLRSLRFTPGEALVPAVAYAFCDYYFHHLSQLNLVCGFLFPLNALLAVRAFRKPTGLRIAGCAFALGVTAYFGEYFAFLVLMLAMVVIAMLIRRVEREELCSKLRAAGPAGLSLGLLVFGLTIAHFWLWWLQARPLPVEPLETLRFSANLAGFFIPDPATTPLYRHVSAALPGDPLAASASRVSAGMGGFEVFVGFPALLLGLIGLWRPTRGARRAGLLALFFWLLSLGPSLKVLTFETGIPLPFSLVQELPPFDQSRTPVRFSAAAAFLWTVTAAAGVRAVTRRAGRRGSEAVRRGVLAALAGWTLAEAWSPFEPPGEPALPVEKMQRDVASGPVLCVPVDGNLGYHVALQTLHGQPISSGYLARLDAAQVELRERLRAALVNEPHELEQLVASNGYRNVLLTEPVPWFVYERLAALPVNVVSVPEQPYPPDSVVVFGTGDSAIPSGRMLAFRRGERGVYLLRQGWSLPEDWGTWSDGEKAVIAFRLEAVRPLLLRAGVRVFEGQEVAAELNGEPLENLIERGAAQLRFRFPERLLRRENRLVFRLPGARSPHSLGMSDDVRRLGVGLEWMVLEDATPHPSPVPAGDHGSADRQS